MVLSDQVEALAEAVGTDMASALEGRGLPTYAGTARPNPFDARTGAYNFKGSNLRGLNTGFALAQNGGYCSIWVIGDSLGIGSDSTQPIEANAFPSRMRKILASALGVPEAGTGIVPVTQTGNATTTLAISNQWSTTGTVSASSTPGLLTMNSGATATYTSLVAGTSVDVYYSNVSTAFSYTIDGGSTINVSAPGGGGDVVRKHTTSSLPNGVHKIVITSGSNWLFLLGVRVGTAVGIEVHNLCFGGTTADSGGITKSWLDTSNVAGIRNTRLGMRTASGLTSHLMITALGGNDIFLGETPTDAITDLESVLNSITGVGHVMVGAYEVADADTTDWNTYMGLKYGLADELDIPFMDWMHLIGHRTDAAAASLLGADSIHPIGGVSKEFGRMLAQVLAANASPLTLDPKADKYLTINAQTGTTYTYVISDAGKQVTFSNASAITVTIPTDAVCPFPIGTVITGRQVGAGQVTFAGSGVTIQAVPGLKIADQYGSYALVKEAINTWSLVGRLSA